MVSSSGCDDMSKERRPSGPGKVLMAEFMVPYNLTVTGLARDLGVSRKHLSEVVHGHKRVTVAMAVKLARRLDTTVELWLNLQNAVDIWEEGRKVS